MKTVTSRVGCRLLVAPVVCRRPEEAGEEEEEDGGMGGRCRVRMRRVSVGGESHAVTEAGLRRLSVARRRRVAVAVRLLRGHGHVGPRREHQLRRSCNTNITVTPPHDPVQDGHDSPVLKRPSLP